MKHAEKPLIQNWTELQPVYYYRDKNTLLNNTFCFHFLYFPNDLFFADVQYAWLCEP